MAGTSASSTMRVPCGMAVVAVECSIQRALNQTLDSRARSNDKIKAFIRLYYLKWSDQALVWFIFNTCCRSIVDVKHLVESLTGVAMENDGTALKPPIQYGEKQQINVVLKMTTNIEFVKANPVPKSEFLKENVVTEANVTYGVVMPVSVTY